MIATYEFAAKSQILTFGHVLFSALRCIVRYVDDFLAHRSKFVHHFRTSYKIKFKFKII